MTRRQLSARLRALRHWNRKESDLDEELQFHLAEEADERAAAGLSADDARAAARRDFGNVGLIREATREIWGWGSAERLMQDLGYGWRTLRATPLVSAVAILSLALGIGANTAIFSVVDTLLLRSLPVEAPHQLAILGNESGRRTLVDQPDLGAVPASPRPRRRRVRGVEHALQSGHARRERARRRPVGQRDDVRRARRAARSSAGRSPTRTIDRAAGRTVPSPSSATPSGSGGSAARPT